MEATIQYSASIEEHAAIICLREHQEIRFALIPKQMM